MIPSRLLPILRASLMVAAFATSAAATAQQTPADREDAALAYAQCMRDNGYAEFPDPTPEGGVRFQINPGSAPRFHEAAAACRHLAPEGMRDEDMTSEDLEASVEMARCIREHGVPEFPDPDSKGRFSLRSAGLEPGSQKLEAAMKACVSGDGPRRGFRFGG